MLALFFGAKCPLSEIVRNYWPIFPVAFVVSLIATPICRKLALRLNVPWDDLATPLVNGAKVDLWESGWPNGRFYWTVVPVRMTTKDDG